MKKFFDDVSRLLAEEESQDAKKLALYMYCICRDIKDIDFSRFDLETLNGVLEDALAYVPLDVYDDTEDTNVNVGLSVHDAEAAWTIQHEVFQLNSVEDEDDFF